MRNLRERLMAVASKPPAAKPNAPKESAFFMREQCVPLSELRGIEQVTLDDVRAFDPLFTGTSWDIQKLLFLDTETTGLSGGAGTVAFEIGIGWIDAHGMVIRQYIMRDYTQEAAMLEDIAQLIRKAETLVTFNGKTFDLPLLESRMVMNRIRLHVTDYPHLDLLHAARRVYKLRLGRCNLSALEEAVLGKTREDDLPGAEVPQRFFDYLKMRDFSLLEDVLRHNFDDVKSLAELTGHLCVTFRMPEQIGYAEDLFSVGRTLLRVGQTQKARNCFKIVGRSTLSPQAHMVLSSSYKKSREWTQAIETWQTMIANGEGGVWPYIELAKYYEHACRDIPRALSYATNALQYMLNTSIPGREDENSISGIHKRINRLRSKQAINETNRSINEGEIV